MYTDEDRTRDARDYYAKAKDEFEQRFKSKSREERRNNQRKMRVSGRSVFELQRLRARPLKPRRRPHPTKTGAS